MEIIISAADPAATAELVARATYGKSFAPPCRRHPGRWRGGPGNGISIVAVGPEMPPEGVYLALPEGRLARLPELSPVGDGTWRVLVAGTSIPCAPSLPDVRLRADAGKEYYVEPLLEQRAARIRDVMERLGVANARAVGPAFVNEFIDASRRTDHGFLLVVDGHEDTDLRTLDVILAEGDAGDRMRARLSHGMDDRAIAAMEQDAWWLDEVLTGQGR
ncbi:hypothetical protein EQZ23_06870 [Sphingomonas sp. UV9]|uniref:hypothetical protein n=1 Tax=Sphingomonas sp. UV9 TaxID=1851410 RepID=UPI000FFC7914|nr:hypothetical protein [Sphingomonas sp. UV9]RXD04858.1 hypothetical protein EQZ23_06870 [Sphingomonas sp. UV9]